MADYVKDQNSGVVPLALPTWSRARFRNTVWLDGEGDPDSKCFSDRYVLLRFVILIFSLIVCLSLL